MASPKLLETFASVVGNDVDEPRQADLSAGVRLRAAEHIGRSLTPTAALPVWRGEPRAVLSQLSEIDAAQDNSGRRALELGRLIFAGGARLDALAQPHELLLTLARSRAHHTIQLIHGGGGDRARDLLVAVEHREQDHHPVVLVN